ncbi:pectinesterase family protein [Plebeiibacterium sediminum]|uniref:Pectinesterase n=1 Tax=Plebeiibacterium sediminum TaxID=2992112 RepID=A0AAE3M6P5_9BACT|nr:pectinesterase family protein [Plebeiobacterium sediminum]MCW3787986.1 pectinesterase family protein [Plebeiobacterium sediminum]
MKWILNKVFGIIMLTFLLSVTVSGQDKVIVAADGSGDYSTIQEALNHCKAFRDYEQEIFIKDGIYHEKVLVDSFLTNIKLIGESKENTIITYSDHAGMPGVGTFNSYTVKVLGDNITMVNLTIENASGEVGQAVALHVEGDLFEIKDCNLLGNQDTLYAAGKNSRQLFKDCFIDGTTDFIFGAAIAVFENCTLHSKRNSYITAASTTKDHKYGYVFKGCKLTAEEGVDKVYLGRPWRDYANVVFIECEMGAHIVPEGWHNWGQPNREKTSFYAEYNSKGTGANVEKRVKWSHQLTKKQAKQYSIDNIFRFEVEMD